MHDFAARHGLLVREEVSHGEYRRGGRVMRSLITAYARTVAFLSLGRVHARAANLTFVLEKPALAAAAPVMRPQQAAMQPACSG
jgi:hypothetical protein